MSLFTLHAKKTMNSLFIPANEVDLEDMPAMTEEKLTPKLRFEALTEYLPGRKSFEYGITTLPDHHCFVKTTYASSEAFGILEDACVVVSVVGIYRLGSKVTVWVKVLDPKDHDEFALITEMIGSTEPKEAGHEVFAETAIETHRVLARLRETGFDFDNPVAIDYKHIGDAMGGWLDSSPL